LTVLPHGALAFVRPQLSDNCGHTADPTAQGEHSRRPYQGLRERIRSISLNIFFVMWNALAIGCPTHLGVAPGTLKHVLLLVCAVQDCGCGGHPGSTGERHGNILGGGGHVKRDGERHVGFCWQQLLMATPSNQQQMHYGTVLTAGQAQYSSRHPCPPQGHPPGLDLRCA
jgi:hypothetical protein